MADRFDICSPHGIIPGHHSAFFNVSTLPPITDPESLARSLKAEAVAAEMKALAEDHTTLFGMAEMTQVWGAKR